MICTLLSKYMNKNNISIVKEGQYEGNIGLVHCSIKVIDIIYDKVIYWVNDSETYSEMKIEEFNKTFQLVMNN